VLLPLPSPRLVLAHAGCGWVTGEVLVFLGERAIVPLRVLCVVGEGDQLSGR
jgi:hypothetical protein